MAVLAGNESGLDDAQRLAEIIDISYDYTMLSFPEFATYRGDPRGQDRWTDGSETALLKRRADEDIYEETITAGWIRWRSSPNWPMPTA